MRCMVRNKRKFYYASYIKTNEITDEYGNKTGEYEVLYSNPTECKGNISGAQGELEIRQFGESVRYDKVIVLDNVGSPDIPPTTIIRLGNSLARTTTLHIAYRNGR